MNDDKVDLLIVGAGPVGITAALEAHRLGISVRIIDRKEKRSTHDSRAVVVHPRVMELLQPINNGGVVHEIQNASFHLKGVEFYMKKWFGMKGVKKDGYDHLLLNLRNVNWGDTEYPNLYFLPQYETEHILEQALNAAGITVEYGVELENLTQANNSVTVVLLDKNGMKETINSRWVLGADGGRSKTRELVGIEMNRNRSDLYFIIADVVFRDPPLDSHAPGKGGHIFPTDNGVIAMFPLPGNNCYRLLAQAPKGIKSKDQVDMNPAFFEKLLFDRIGKKFEVDLGPWQTIFEITHGTSHSYRKGNVLLSGDASHVHSPVGGQGMNLGIQDANNILWKLAWAKRILDNASTDGEKAEAEAAADIIIGSYDTERHALGQNLVKSVQKATGVLATRNPFVRFIRNSIIRLVIPRNGTPDNFRRAGQLELAYPPDSSAVIIKTNKASKHRYICYAGQRLPNIRLIGGSNLHSQIDRVHHTWVFLNHHSSESVLPEGHIAYVSAAKFNEQVSVPVISEEAYATKQVLLVRPDLFVAGVDETRESLLEELHAAGLNEKAISMM